MNRSMTFASIVAWTMMAATTHADTSARADTAALADSATTQQESAPAPSGAIPQLQGEWRLDPAASDQPQRPEGAGAGGWRRGGGGGGGGGGWSGGGPGGSGSGREGGGDRGRWGGGRNGGMRRAGDVVGGRPARLPDLMHVTQTETLISFEDSTGKVLQEIVTVSGEADSLMHAPGAPQFHGTWKDQWLTVERGREGFSVRQSYGVENGALIVRITVPPRDGQEERTFKRVYRRTES